MGRWAARPIGGRAACSIGAGGICWARNCSFGPRLAEPPPLDSGGGSMVTLAREIPQLPALVATLRKITEGLAEELACPTQFAPDWSDVERNITQAVAAIRTDSPLFSRAFLWQC